MPVKVLIIPSWYPTPNRPELGCFFRSQAKSLASLGNEVGVLSIQLRSIRDRNELLLPGYGSHYEDDGAVPTFRHVGVGFPHRYPRLNGYLWRLNGMKLYRRYVKEHGRPDIVHIHSMLYAGTLALQIFREDVVPYVVTEHSSIYERNLIRGSHLRIAKEISAYAARRLAVSSKLCSFLNNKFDGGSWNKIANPVDSLFLAEELPERVPRTNASFDFVAIGGLQKNKGFDLLLKAFCRVFINQKEIKLKIVGQGPEKNNLERMARDLGIDNQIELAGSLSRVGVMEALRASDAFVHASHYETFGVVIIEALALGRPVIATRCGGPESIVNDDVGILVPTNSVEALANAMRRMYLSYDKYNPILIRKYCESRFSESVVIAELSCIYQNILDGNQKIDSNRK